MNYHVIGKFLHGLCYSATAGAIFGAINSDQLLTWSAVIVAISSAILTASVAGYHKLREAARLENQADRAADLESLRAIKRLQIELEQRVASIEQTANEVAKTLILRKAEITSMFDDIKAHFTSMHADVEKVAAKQESTS